MPVPERDGVRKGEEEERSARRCRVARKRVSLDLPHPFPTCTLRFSFVRRRSFANFEFRIVADGIFDAARNPPCAPVTRDTSQRTRWYPARYADCNIDFRESPASYVHTHHRICLFCQRRGVLVPVVASERGLMSALVLQSLQ